MKRYSVISHYNNENENPTEILLYIMGITKIKRKNKNRPWQERKEAGILT